MKATTKQLILLVILIFSITACTAVTPEEDTPQNPTENTPEPTDAPNTEPTPDRSIREETDEEKLPEQVPTMETQPTTGEVPDELMELILNDLSQRIGGNPEDIVVERAESALWSDGSLGCPKPGEVYTQSPTQGYWVVLSYEGIEYDYRATNTNYFFLCANPLPGGSGGAPIG